MSSTINLNVSGGTAPYTYRWNDDVTDANRTGLTAGTYTVTVTDKNKCTATHSVTIAETASATPTCPAVEFNTPTYGVKLQLRNWITARLGHTDWVLIDAKRCDNQWYTDLGLGAFPFPSNDSRTGTYMTNFFGYGIQNCRDVSSGYDNKASMLQAVKVTLNNENNCEVIIPVENYYDNSVTVSSYDGI